MTRVAALLILVVAGCGSHAVHGTVATMPATCAGSGLEPAEPAPLPGAEVALWCPDRPSAVEVTHTDDEGRFRLAADDTVSAACWVDVSAAGYWPRRYPVDGVCFGDGECEGASVPARLLRRGGAP